KARYQVPNYVATVLGEGQYGGGLGLERDGDVFRSTPNNLGLCVRHLLGRRGIALDDEAAVRQGARRLPDDLGGPDEALEAQLAPAEARPIAGAAQAEAQAAVAC